MSRSRLAILELVQAQPEPTALAALVAGSGLHANTVREHLEALTERGLVRRQQATPAGRGRPAWLYEATPTGEQERRSEYAGLAATLASAIHRTSSSPREDAIVAGTEWGRDLARNTGRGLPTGQAAARREVIELLGEIGFAPEADKRASRVRLTRCPLLEAAHRFPDVVCGVHLGIVRGAMEEYGADASRSDLFPFSEPGACRLELMVRPGAEPA
jgi:predicted ArsR family transcriptional regulator